MILFLLTNNNIDVITEYSVPILDIINFCLLSFGEYFECQKLFFRDSPVCVPMLAVFHSASPVTNSTALSNPPEMTIGLPP